LQPSTPDPNNLVRLEDYLRYAALNNAGLKAAFHAWKAALEAIPQANALPGLNLRGCSYTFAGTYENQLRAQKTLSIVVPLALLIIFIILYLQFHSVTTGLLVFLGILVAWAGGFLMIWLYSRH